MTTEYKRVQLKAFTAATWTGTNPVLLDRELGIEKDTGKAKLGDGVTAWNALGYLTLGGGGTGNVAGPASAVSGNLAIFDGATGKILADSAVNLGLLAPKASPTFTGTVSGITASMVGLSNVPDVNATVAQNIVIADAGNYYASDNVEAALQVVGAYLAAKPLPPAPSISGPTTAAGAEGSFATYTVALSSATAATATATVTINHITTTSADISSLSVKLGGVWTPVTSGSTITLPVGSVDLPIQIYFVDDAAAEGSETFSVAVVGVTGLSGSVTTTVTIADNGVAPVPVLASVGSLLSSTGDLVITLPSLAVGDMAIVVMQTANQIPATPSGWSVAPGAGSGTAGAAGAYRVSTFHVQATAVNTPASVTFTDPGDHMYAVVLKVTGGDTVANPYHFNNNYINAAATQHWIDAGSAAFLPNSLVFYAFAHGISTTAPQFNTYTPPSGLSSFSEQFDGSATLGVGGGIAIATGACVAGGVLGSLNFIMQASTAISSLTFSISPSQPLVPPVQGTGAQIKQAVIDGMQGANQGIQLGYQRAVYASVSMGLVAKGTNTPTWWGGLSQYKDADPWTGISPWWVLVPLQGNAANTASLEIGTIMLLTRAAGTNNYTVLYKGKSSWGARFDKTTSTYISSITGTAGTVPGYTSVVYPLISQPSDDTMHGGGGLQTIDATTIDNLIVIMAARLTGPDVSIAKWALLSGADWYPYVGYNVNANPPGWAPAVGSGRLSAINDNWKLFAMAPLSNPGRGSDTGSYPYGTVGVYCDDAQFKANPIPDIDGMLPP